jgi:hypothetical protein
MAKDLNHIRDIIENKIDSISNIVSTELMTVLKTNKEEQIISLKNDGWNNVTVKELKIHEHNFIPTRTQTETSLVCSTYGLLYCEKCGKLVKKRHAGIERRITISKTMNEYWRRMNTDRNISALPLCLLVEALDS